MTASTCIPASIACYPRLTLYKAHIAPSSHFTRSEARACLFQDKCQVWCLRSTSVVAVETSVEQVPFSSFQKSTTCCTSPLVNSEQRTSLTITTHRLHPVRISSDTACLASSSQCNPNPSPWLMLSWDSLRLNLPTCKLFVLLAVPSTTMTIIASLR